MIKIVFFILELMTLSIGISLLLLKNKFSYLGMLFISLFASVPELYYIPHVYDLYNYFAEMRVVQSCTNVHSLLEMYKEIPILSHDSNNYVYDIFQWCIARSNNYILLCFFSILIIYFCVSVPVIHQQIINKFGFKRLFIGIMISISLFPYFYVGSTVRWNIASAIFFLLMYISFNSRFNNIWIFPLYILIVFVHQGMILPVGLFILCILLIGSHKKLFLSLLCFVFIAIFFYLIIKNNTELFLETQFYHNTSVFEFLGGSSLAELDFIASCVVPYIYLILAIALIQCNKNIDFGMNAKILLVFTVIDVLLLFNLTIFNRYALDVGLLSLLIFFRTMKYNGKMNFVIKYSYIITSLAAFLLMVLSIVFKMNFDFSHMDLGELFSGY